MPVREGGIGWSPDYKSEFASAADRITELYQALVAMLNEHGCVEGCPACDKAQKVLE